MGKLVKRRRRSRATDSPSTKKPELTVAATAQPGGQRAWWIGAIVLVTAIIVAYIPAIHGGFVLDDADCVSDNPLLRSHDGLWRIWSQGVPKEHYWPVTYTAFWLEYQVWGVAPGGYHTVNVLLHAANAALVWRILARVQIKGAWLGAATFALHPVHVESVAWVTERKDVLSGVLYLAAFLAYMTFAAAGQWRWYALSLALFALGMLSKLSVVTLPLAIGVWLWWRNGRLVRDDVARLAPMLGLALVMGLADLVLVRQVQPRHTDFSLLERVVIAGRALCFYAGKLVWPAELIPIYPRWTIDASAAWQWLPLGAVVATFSLAVLTRRRFGRGPLAAAVYFVVTLVPMLGFVDHTFRGWSLVADRFQYLASIGPIALVASSAARVSALSPPRPWVLQAAGAALLLVLGVLTWRQAAVYTSADTYYAAVIAGNPSRAFPHYNLADYLMASGRIDEAIEHYEEALRLEPDEMPEARTNLANALVKRGRLDEAIHQYEKAVELHPDFGAAHANLARILLALGRTDEAIQHYEDALRLDPNDAKGHYKLAVALAGRGRTDEAVAHYKEVRRLNPDFANAHDDPAKALSSRAGSSRIREEQRLLESVSTR